MASSAKFDKAAIGRMLREDPAATRSLLVAGDKVKRRTLQLMEPSGSQDGAFFPREFFKTRIHTRLQKESDGPHAFVGATDTKTKPHVIQAQNSPKQVLAFSWPKRGTGTFYFKKVNHPGSDLTKYVNTKLVEALATLRGTL